MGSLGPPTSERHQTWIPGALPTHRVVFYRDQMRRQYSFTGVCPQPLGYGGTSRSIATMAMSTSRSSWLYVCSPATIGRSATCMQHVRVPYVELLSQQRSICKLFCGRAHVRDIEPAIPSVSR